MNFVPLFLFNILSVWQQFSLWHSHLFMSIISKQMTQSDSDYSVFLMESSRKLHTNSQSKVKTCFRFWAGRSKMRERTNMKWNLHIEDWFEKREERSIFFTWNKIQSDKWLSIEHTINHKKIILKSVDNSTRQGGHCHMNASIKWHFFHLFFFYLNLLNVCNEQVNDKRVSRKRFTTV